MVLFLMRNSFFFNEYALDLFPGTKKCNKTEVIEIRHKNATFLNGVNVAGSKCIFMEMS